MLRLLPSRLETLLLNATSRWPATDNDRLIREGGQPKAMKTNELELLRPVLSRDNFRDLRLFEFKFQLVGYRDTLPLYRECTFEAIQRKLSTLRERTILEIQLDLILVDRTPPPSPR